MAVGDPIPQVLVNPVLGPDQPPPPEWSGPPTWNPIPGVSTSRPTAQQLAGPIQIAGGTVGANPIPQATPRIAQPAIGTPEYFKRERQNMQTEADARADTQNQYNLATGQLQAQAPAIQAAGDIQKQREQNAADLNAQLAKQEHEIQLQRLGHQQTLEQQAYQNQQELQKEYQGAALKPWGKLGIGGKIGRVAEDIGDVIAPGIMERIPGDPLHQAIEREAIAQRMGTIQEQGTKEQAAEAEMIKAEQARAAARKTPAEQAYESLTTGGPDGGPQTMPNGQPYTPLDALHAVTEPRNQPMAEQLFNQMKTNDPQRNMELARRIVQATKIVSPSEQLSATANSAYNKLASSVNIADPVALQKAISPGTGLDGRPAPPPAVASGLLTQDEANAIATDQASKARAVTQLNLAPEKQTAVQAAKNANDFYWDAAGNAVRGSDLPPGQTMDTQKLIGDTKELEKYQGEAKQLDVIAQSANQLMKDTDWRIFDNAAANAAITKYLEPGTAQRVGLWIAGTGGQMPNSEGLTKVANKVLLDTAVPKELLPAVRKFLVDYYFLKDTTMATAQLIQDGKIGRGNAQYYTDMANQLPGPNSDSAAMAIFAMARYRGRIAMLGSQLGNMPTQRLDTLGMGPTSYPDGTRATLQGRKVEAISGYWIPQ